MNYFDTFCSNTDAASGNQFYFTMKENEVRTGRLFYKISVGGAYSYSILFSNVMDSTYADGSISWKNLLCKSWTIHRARIGKCVRFPAKNQGSDIRMEDNDGPSDILLSDWKTVTFDGKFSKRVEPGEFFSTDPISLSFLANEYLCLELTFSGSMIPYHEETLIPTFLKQGASWRYSQYMPFAGMIGCDRKVKARIVYLGDSITQGIGTKPNSYQHWTALLSEKLGPDYSYWNLGIGYGRAGDAASDGAWLYKARQSDIVFLEFGVNDLLQGGSEHQILEDITYLVKQLKREGKKVILQTLPPFSYDDAMLPSWHHINQYLRTKLKPKVDLLFDNVLYWGQADYPHLPRYGDHPNEEGCRIVADALYEKLIESKILDE